MDVHSIYRYYPFMKEIAVLHYPGGTSRILCVAREDLLPSEVLLSVLDENTAQLFPDHNPERSLVLPPGEVTKSWTSVERILDRTLALSLGRDGLLVGIGGGVVTDVTAFAASIYMRGCRLILIPTTLLSMVDAAIGGKTGFDFGGVKNLVGSFFPAEEIRICPDLLATLPEKEYLSGLAEVIKHALLTPGPASGGLLDMVMNERKAILARDAHTLERLVIAAVKVKIDIVSDDLREHGKRAFLNLGHTFGHALESATHFSRWSHGEAVAWGILKALHLGELIGVTDRFWATRARLLIADYGFNTVTPQVAPGEIKAAMKNDKKKKDGCIRFVLIKTPGESVLQEVSEGCLDTVLGIR